MANENKTNVATTSAAVDPRDEKLKLLEKTVKDLSSEVEALTRDAKASEEELKKLRAKGPPKLPENVVILPGGKQLEIVRMVQAKFALDEVKKGFLEEDLELIVTKRG